PPGPLPEGGGGEPPRPPRPAGRDHVELRIGWPGIALGVWFFARVFVDAASTAPLFTGGFFEGDRIPSWAPFLAYGPDAAVTLLLSALLALRLRRVQGGTEGRARMGFL